MPISLALASIFGSYADHENRVMLAEKDIVLDNYVKKEKVQRFNGAPRSNTMFRVSVLRLPAHWDMCTTPNRGITQHPFVICRSSGD